MNIVDINKANSTWHKQNKESQNVGNPALTLFNYTPADTKSGEKKMSFLLINHRMWFLFTKYFGLDTSRILFV